MAVNAESYYINDLSTELIDLYKNIATSDETFFWYSELMDASWENAVAFFKNNIVLVDKYIEYREEKVTKEDLKQYIHDFCKEKKDEISEDAKQRALEAACINMGIDTSSPQNVQVTMEEGQLVVRFDFGEGVTYVTTVDPNSFVATSSYSI